MCSIVLQHNEEDEIGFELICWIVSSQKTAI